VKAAQAGDWATVAGMVSFLAGRPFRRRFWQALVVQVGSVVWFWTAQERELLCGPRSRKRDRE